MTQEAQRRDCVSPSLPGEGAGTAAGNIFPKIMAMEFGWWNKDPEEGKYQVCVEIHGGNISWQRKQGHHQPWAEHQPSEDDWSRLVEEAQRRVPRRLISPKQMAEILRIVEARD